ncbi:MAG: hypothetical protein GY796_16520 [Chloroflexi bacterium]|nr:hypothetical protein [Chloroflexota bacterium]
MDNAKIINRKVVTVTLLFLLVMILMTSTASAALTTFTYLFVGVNDAGLGTSEPFRGSSPYSATASDWDNSVNSLTGPYRDCDLEGTDVDPTTLDYYAVLGEGVDVSSCTLPSDANHALYTIDINTGVATHICTMTMPVGGVEMVGLSFHPTTAGEVWGFIEGAGIYSLDITDASPCTTLTQQWDVSVGATCNENITGNPIACPLNAWNNWEGVAWDNTATLFYGTHNFGLTTRLFSYDSTQSPANAVNQIGQDDCAIFAFDTLADEIEALEFTPSSDVGGGQLFGAAGGAVIGSNPQTQLLVFDTGAAATATDCIASTHDYQNTIYTDIESLTFLPELDFGDLPASYSTTLSGNGAYHTLDNSLYLGNGIDAEADGNPAAAADGDDNANTAGSPDANPDEDGIVVPSGSANTFGDGSGDIQVTVSGAGCLIGWFDWDQSGAFEDVTVNGANELILNEYISGASTPTFAVTTPLSPAYTYPTGGNGLYARYRLFSVNDPIFTGLTLDGDGCPTGETAANMLQLVGGKAFGGEVEDYFQQFSSPTAVTLQDIATSAESTPAIFAVAVALVAVLTGVGVFIGRKQQN